MAIDIVGNGIKNIYRKRDMVSLYLKMDPNLKDFTKIIMLTDMVGIFYLMERFGLVIGLTVKLMEKGSIIISMELTTKETGWTTNKTALVKNSGQMDAGTKGSTQKE